MATSQPSSTLKSHLLMKLGMRPASTATLVDYAKFQDGIVASALKSLANEGLIDGDINMWTVTAQGAAKVVEMTTAIYEAVTQAPPPN